MAYQVPHHVLRARLEGEEVLLNEETGAYHVLNPTGRRVMEGLEEGRDPDELIAAIVAETGEELRVVAEDVASFVSALLGRGLLEDAPPP
jgi:hypothetical protein